LGVDLTYRQADAQVYRFAPEHFDLVRIAV
jgi:hypothetical protein